MARLADIVFDATHAASLARFWAAALDGYAIAPYDDEEIARLRALGFDGPEDDPSVIIEGPGLRVCCQLVPEGKTAKNRAHVDLACIDLEAEVARLETLGARRLDHQPPPEDRYVALVDQQGNEFCLVQRD